MRYRPKLEWSKTWVQNPFRLFEFIFGRKYGPRLEAVTSTEGGKITRKFYTLEARLSHYEACVRAFFGLAMNLPLDQRLTWQTGAIAFPDTSTGVESVASPQTVTHTASGSDRLAIVGFSPGPNGATCTAASYDGADIRTNSSTAGNALGGTTSITIPSNQEMYLYFLCAPSTTTNATVSATSSGGSSYHILNVSTFSGCAQTNAVIDSTNTGTGSAVTSASVSTTVVASNCWLVGWCRNNGGHLFTAGAQTTLRVDELSGGGSHDSNGTVSTGSQAQNLTWSTNATFGMIVASIAPPAATSVKTYKGLLTSGVKTVKGLAIASRKNKKGLA